MKILTPPSAGLKPNCHRRRWKSFAPHQRAAKPHPPPSQGPCVSRCAAVAAEQSVDEDAARLDDVYVPVKPPVNHALEAIRVTLREFRSLQDDLRPWAQEHLTRTGRRPSSADAELSGLPWVQDMYKRYTLARQKLYMEIPGLAECLPPSQFGAKGGTVMVKNVNKAIAAQVRNTSGRLSRVMGYQQQTSERAAMKAAEVKMTSAIQAAAAAAAAVDAVGVVDVASAAFTGSAAGTAAAAAQPASAAAPAAPASVAGASPDTTPLHTSSHSPHTSTQGPQPSVTSTPLHPSSPLSASPLTDAPPPAPSASAYPFLPSQRAPPSLVTPPPSPPSSPPAPPSQGDDRIKSAFLSALSYRKKKDGAPSSTSPSPPAHPQPLSASALPPTPTPKVIYGTFKQTGHRRRRWLDENADDLVEAAAGVAVMSPDFTAAQCTPIVPLHSAPDTPTV